MAFIILHLQWYSKIKSMHYTWKFSGILGASQYHKLKSLLHLTIFFDHTLLNAHELWYNDKKLQWFSILFSLWSKTGAQAQDETLCSHVTQVIWSSVTLKKSVAWADFLIKFHAGTGVTLHITKSIICCVSWMWFKDQRIKVLYFQQLLVGGLLKLLSLKLSQGIYNSLRDGGYKVNEQHLLRAIWKLFPSLWDDITVLYYYWFV